MKMSGKISERGKLYTSGGRVVFVSSGGSCPRINLTERSETVKFRDDYSKGFRTNKNLAKLVFG